MMIPKLYLIRHGQSEWNAQDIFTGWVDVGLTIKGEEEAKSAGKALQKRNIHFDHVYTSVLQRSIKTAWIILEQMHAMAAPQTALWELNERHYGALQGKNKSQMRQEVGEEQVKIGRRSYSTRPPESQELQNVSPYAQGLLKAPSTESLEDTVQRVIQVWERVLFPQIKSGKTILISAHGNSLRGLLKHLESISDKEIVELEIPTGKPIEISFDSNYKVSNRVYIN